MPSNIILSSEEIVVCPKCAHRFAIELGITKQTMEQYEREYDRTFQERSKELKAELSKEAAKDAEKLYKSKISELNEQIEASNQELKRSQGQMKKLKAEIEAKAREEFDEERKSMQEQLDEKEAAIKDFRAKEIALRKDRNKLEEEKKNFELEQQRKLDEAKKEIEKRTAEAEAEKFKFKEAEYKKKLNDALQANAELTRKLEQGSQQLQGEVLELELESLLRNSFPYDDIKEIAKGIRGADVLQCVHTQAGMICGAIIWEAKRAQNWSDRWLRKVKDDCIGANADIPVIVSTVLPKECKEPFKIIDGVWVISDSIIRPVAETLRVMLIETNRLKTQNEGSLRKADLIYSYLSTPQFAQNLRSILESFAQMKRDLDREKAAMYRTWKKRETQLERVAVGMSSMVGQIQAIAQDSLPQLESIEQLLLPGESEAE
jgi:hypothetical protein